MGTIFSAYDIRGKVGESLTIEYAWTVGKAFAESLDDEGDIVIARNLGADESIMNALIEGMLLQGRNVINTGEGNQLTIVSSIRQNDAAGGVVVSHDTLQNIGIITLFDAQGTVVTDQSGLTAVEELITAGNFLPAAKKGEVRII